MKKTDIFIVGQGPAGLSAAIYTARAGLSTTVIGGIPKIAADYAIDNYFGFTETITGKDLIERGKKQAERFGVQIFEEKALQIHQNDNGNFHIQTTKDEYEATALILAPGVSRVRPGISNLSDYEGQGVSYCVSCDGPFIRQKKVIVVGEAVFAANQALELLQYTPQVSICTQKKTPAISEEYMVKLQAAKIAVHEKKITRLLGTNGLESVEYDDGSTEDVYGIFIALGEASSADFAYTLGIEQKGAYLVADEKQQTNIPGVYAAGDCLGRYLQISVAVGEGAMAGHSAISYVKNKKDGATEES